MKCPARVHETCEQLNVHRRAIVWNTISASSFYTRGAVGLISSYCTWCVFNSSSYGSVEHLRCGISCCAGVIKVDNKHPNRRRRAGAWLCAEEVNFHLHSSPVKLPQCTCSKSGLNASCSHMQGCAHSRHNYGSRYCRQEVSDSVEGVPCLIVCMNALACCRPYMPGRQGSCLKCAGQETTLDDAGPNSETGEEVCA